MIEPGKPDKLTDVELLEALELGAARIRMASAEDLRHVGDALAGLALEAAGRLRDVLEIAPRPPAVFKPIEDVPAADYRRRFESGPTLGKIRGVVLHADGRLTCELEINDAGRVVVEQIKRAAGPDGPGFRS